MKVLHDRLLHSIVIKMPECLKLYLSNPSKHGPGPLLSGGPFVTVLLIFLSNRYLRTYGITVDIYTFLTKLPSHVTGTIIIPSCPPFQFSVPLKYYFLTQDQDRLKKRHNSSYDNAWCKYCIDSTVESFQGDEIDKEDADWVLSTTVKRLQSY